MDTHESARLAELLCSPTLTEEEVRIELAARACASADPPSRNTRDVRVVRIPRGTQTE